MTSAPSLKRGCYDSPRPPPPWSGSLPSSSNIPGAEWVGVGRRNVDLLTASYRDSESFCIVLNQAVQHVSDMRHFTARPYSCKRVRVGHESPESPESRFNRDGRKVYHPCTIPHSHPPPASLRPVWGRCPPIMILLNANDVGAAR